MIADRPACRKRITEDTRRFSVESTFQDLKHREWDGESSHVRRLDRVDRLLLVRLLMVWWLARLASKAQGDHFPEPQWPLDQLP